MIQYAPVEFIFYHVQMLGIDLCIVDRDVKITQFSSIFLE
jgi:hypothetical protein